MFESRRSRLVGELSGPDRRRIAVNSIGVLLNKTFVLSSDVYLAMQSRGYRGEVYLLDDFVMRRAFNDVYAAMRKHHTHPRAAAYVLAVGRVADATLVRGLFP